MAITFDADGWAVRDVDGWTVVTLSAGKKRVYVSTSIGDNGFDGLSGTVDGGGVGPKATIAAGAALCNAADHLLLKCDDEFTERANAIGGTSATEPGFVGSYGSGARPLMVNQGSISGTSYSVVRGLEFKHKLRDPDDPSYDSGVTDDGCMGTVDGIRLLIVEDCKISFFRVGITLINSATQRVEHAEIRRNIIIDQYDSTNGVSDSTGVFAGGYDKLLIEENLTDRNGWHPDVATSVAADRNHNYYFQGVVDTDPIVLYSSGVTIRGNIMARDASGSQFRSGGIIDNNLGIQNVYTHNLGRPNNGSSPNYIVNCVNTEGVAAVDWGAGAAPYQIETFDFYNVDGQDYDFGTVLISKNIICHDIAASGRGIVLAGTGHTITNNITWDVDNPALQGGTSNTVSGNVEHASNTNDGAGGAPIYTDPSWTIGAYAGSIGLTATTEAFLQACRDRAGGVWTVNLGAPAVNASFRTKFDMTAYEFEGEPAVSIGGRPLRAMRFR